MIGQPAAGLYILPEIGAVMTVPDSIFLTVATKKLHKQATREALEETLIGHWRSRWQRHFKSSNRREYHHLERSANTKARKMKTSRSMTDIVHTGATRNFMTSMRPKFTIARSSTSGKYGTKGVFTTGFPFPTNVNKEQTHRKDGSKAITPTEMAEELSRWTTEDLAAAARIYRRQYAKHMKEKIGRSKRLTTRYGKMF